MINNILFIDDDNNVLDGYKSIFRNHSNAELDAISELLEVGKKEEAFVDEGEYRVFTATQGIQGLDIVEKQKASSDPIKVAFIDMRMPPGMDGAETAKMIAKIDPNVEIVIVTAYSDTKLNEINEKIGRSDKLLYLKKPFDPMEIKQLALNLCHKYRLERLKDEFIGHVSHELMTPLSSILGFSDILRKDPTLPEKEFEPAKVIYNNAVLMRDLVDDLLSVARMEKRPIDLTLSCISLNQFLEQTDNICRILIEKNPKISFEVEKDQGEIVLTCDMVKMERVLTNLITNAYKFTREGIISLTFNLTEDYFCFNVSDTGIGIPVDQLNNIFDKFKRLENKHHGLPGLGLGLSIVKKIVEAHKGTITVESDIGKGSTFSILFDRNSAFKWSNVNGG